LTGSAAKATWDTKVVTRTARLLATAAVLCLIFIGWRPADCATAPTQQTEAQVRAEKLKALYRREPRAQELVPKVEQKIAEAKKSGADAHLTLRLEEAFNGVVMNADSLSQERLHDAVDFLGSMSEPTVKLTDDDLRVLRERYKRLCESIDDQIFIKDLESVLKLHDRFIRHSALGLWNKDQIAAQLKRMEDVFAVAPEIAYGRSELLRTRQDQRLAKPPKGCYFGVFPHEELFLSPERLSVGVLEESTGGNVVTDTADMIIQGPDGHLIDIDQANHPVHGLPFSPPLCLWLKTRVLEGRVPAVMFRLTDKSIQQCYAGAQPSQPEEATYGVADVLEGKLDDYFKRNFKLIAAIKQATAVGFLSNFDRAPAATAFGADGRTPYYLLVDAKLDKLPADKREVEIQKRLEKGSLTKDTGEELRKHYGDAAIPDGPERVRDCWKRLRQLCSEAGANSVSLFATAGSCHGNKKALSLPGFSEAGAQDWNKLEFYWPGERVLDWLGSEAVCPSTAGPEAALGTAVEQFMGEARNSSWRATPVLLRGLAPALKKNPPAESAWVLDTFATLLPNAYPDIKVFFVEYPERLTLWSADARSVFRRNVSSSPYYKQKLNLQAVQHE